MERGVLQGLAAFRWAAWVWMVLVLVVARRDLDSVPVAVIAAGAALAVTAAAHAALHADRSVLLTPAAVLTELAIGTALMVLDGVVAPEGGAFSTRQSLGSVWPLAGVLAAGVAWGPVRGAGAGAAVGLGRVVAVVVNGAAVDEPGRVLSLANTVVFYALAGAVAGHVVRLLLRAEHDVAVARARDEVARTLHDGVLQTLALVERRADDPALAKLAREQELELRQFLFGGTPLGTDLAAGLRALAARFESRFGGRATVVVAEDVPLLGEAQTAALLGAAGEALTNAGKHGHAGGVTVYVEPEGRGVFCSVRDDGGGFEPAETAEGVGLSRSIRARVAEVGGRVDVRSRPGEGTEVCLWVP